MKNRLSGKAPNPSVCADDLTRENVRSHAARGRKRTGQPQPRRPHRCLHRRFLRLHAFCLAACGGFRLLDRLNSWPGLAHFDPYPFTFLTLVVSLEAIFLASFILISQNYELRISDRRNQLDLQINLLTEQENTKMIQMLERIAKKVGADIPDPDVRILKEDHRPGKAGRPDRAGTARGSNGDRGRKKSLAAQTQGWDRPSASNALMTAGRASARFR
jgi:uncharacterized membrane protein